MWLEVLRLLSMALQVPQMSVHKDFLRKSSKYPHTVLVPFENFSERISWYLCYRECERLCAAWRGLCRSYADMCPTDTAPLQDSRFGNQGARHATGHNDKGAYAGSD